MSLPTGRTSTDELVRRLSAQRLASGLPRQTGNLAIKIGEVALTLLFPHLGTSCLASDDDDATAIDQLRGLLDEFIGLLAPSVPNLDLAVTDKFLEQLPTIYALQVSDAEQIFRSDPAAESIEEVVLAYPGFRAIATYRIAHVLYTLELPILPRLLTEWAHTLTGVDIHPGAVIGRNFSIDHGTGVVIGETTVIGHGVKLYQGVTLGAHAVARKNRGRKRHPTVEDNVIIYAHATILGGETVIGHDSVVGGNAWITESIPAFSIVNRQSEVLPRRSSGKDDSSVEFHI